MDLCRFRPRAAAAAVLLLVSGGQALGAAPPPDAGGQGYVCVEARLVDRASGLEAAWGATGQVLLPFAPADPAPRHGPEAPSVAVSSARQSVTLAPGERAELRVGREIPFAGWFLRNGREGGWIEPNAPWREVESALEVEAAGVSADGTVRLVLTPEFAFLQGRVRRGVVREDLRVEVLIAPGEEARLAAGPGHAAFYERFLAGYDPMRRVRPVDLLLRVLPPVHGPPVADGAGEGRRP